MSDNESDALNIEGFNYPSENVPSRPQRSQRIDYHFLNGGSDEEEDVEERVIKKPRLGLPSSCSESVESEESSSQIRQNLSTPSESLPQESSARSLSEALELQSHLGSPMLSHKINGSGVNLKSHHSRGNYGDQNEAGGYWRTEKSDAYSVVGKLQILQEQLQRLT